MRRICRPSALALRKLLLISRRVRVATWNRNRTCLHAKQIGLTIPLIDSVELIAAENRLRAETWCFAPVANGSGEGSEPHSERGSRIRFDVTSAFHTGPMRCVR